jgi:hypothetical protein
MVLLDYAGFRLLAASRLPISSSTLVNGSSNGETFSFTQLI